MSPRAGPSDAVVVLGGGADETPVGAPKLGPAGDRLMLGARLLLTGRTNCLVCAGTPIEGLSRHRRDQGENSAILLKDLGVPDERVIRAFGRNTSEEIRSIKALIGERRWRRVGLVTSAWHMARAMRLARDAQLELQPLPADFRGTLEPWSIIGIIPGGGSFQDGGLACMEILARVVGR
jgi:uncharacterized SAM-binding protein YcdF (DUF218 family)